MSGKKPAITRLKRMACSPYRFFAGAAVLAAAFCLMPAPGNAPQRAQDETWLSAEATAQPHAPQGLPAGADLSERTGQGGMLHRTLYYAPCGHSVQRRESLPASLVGLTRSALEKEIAGVIVGAKVTGFSAQEVDISVEMAIPCPLHWVLRKGENGRLQVLQNMTGEALSVVRESDEAFDLLPGEAQEQLLEGMVFDDVQMLEGYLESLGS